MMAAVTVTADLRDMEGSLFVDAYGQETDGAAAI
jgi:hypothetical protein